VRWLLHSSGSNPQKSHLHVSDAKKCMYFSKQDGAGLYSSIVGTREVVYVDVLGSKIKAVLAI